MQSMKLVSRRGRGRIGRRLGALAASALLSAGILSIGFVQGPAVDAEAKGKADEHCRYQKTYAGAIAEARERNTVLLLTFHKDN